MKKRRKRTHKFTMLHVLLVKGVVLHGGLGTRLRPLTHAGPKQLIPIANKPMSWYAVNALVEAGISEIAIVVSPSGEEAVQRVYGDGHEYGARIVYVVQPKPLGIANAIEFCREFVEGDPFVVYLGDNLMRESIAGYAREFEESNLEALLLTTPVPNPQMFGVVSLDSAGRATRLVEKPKNPTSNLALVGVYFLRSKIFEQIEQLKPSWRDEYEITEALQGLIDKKYPVECRRVVGWWKDTGTVADILEANRFILHEFKTEILGGVGDDCQLIGVVRLASGAKIIGKSVLRGPCVIGENSIIGPNAYVGPYTSVGGSVEIRDTEVENSIIANDCRVSCGGRIVDSIVGSHSSLKSANELLPSGKRVQVGENSVVYL